MIEGWETVIGLEVHCELATHTKLFCGCPNLFGDEPNTNVCPVCLGLPGSLPVLNANAVELAVRLGQALHCSVERSEFMFLISQRVPSSDDPARRTDTLASMRNEPSSIFPSDAPVATRMARSSLT